MHELEDIGSNPTDNPALADMVALRVSRRGVVGGGLAAAAVTFLGGGAAAAASIGRTSATATATGGRHRPLLGFEEVPVSAADTFVVPEGYTYDVLIPWGTPLSSGGPAWREDASNSAAEQAEQVGQHHDGMHFFPLGRRRGLLVLNHEYVDPTLLTTDGATPVTPDKVAKALAAHGVTVVELREGRDGRWRHVDSRFNRRITGTTPVEHSGPVSIDHPAMQSNNAPMGTLNNCAHGFTPWGTYLASEENWNGYFGTADATWTATPAEARYGINARGFAYDWHLADPRFDLAVNRNELNRFGWVVEIDPYDPRSTPVKRTALGRVKHEGATVTEREGRVVVYSGDDENGDYLYKFVGSESWRRLHARGRSPLDHGTLHVARLDPEGGGTWVPLAWGQGPLTAANGWTDQADVLLRTRQAADAVGAPSSTDPSGCRCTRTPARSTSR